MDRIDFKIIAELQNNSRISNKELAAKISLAPSSTHQRMAVLENSGVIQGHHTDIAPESLGITIQAMIAIRQTSHGTKSFQKLYRYIKNLKEVISVYFVSGADDLLVHVGVQSIAHLRELVEYKITCREEVSLCETSVIYEHFKNHKLPNLYDDQ